MHMTTRTYTHSPPAHPPLPEGVSHHKQTVSSPSPTLQIFTHRYGLSPVAASVAPLTLLTGSTFHNMVPAPLSLALRPHSPFRLARRDGLSSGRRQGRCALWHLSRWQKCTGHHCGAGGRCSACMEGGVFTRCVEARCVWRIGSLKLGPMALESENSKFQN